LISGPISFSLFAKTHFGLVHCIVKLLEKEPEYLTAHRDDVGNIIIGFLAGSGLQWHREIFEREWPEILRQALARLDKGKGRRRETG
jgi:hypothetical protein